MPEAEATTLLQGAAGLAVSLMLFTVVGWFVSRIH